MTHSIFWARLLGLYCVIISAWSFINLKHLPNLMAVLENNPPVLMTLGIFSLLLGLAIVVSHPLYRGWPIIVTLVGYWIIIKSMLLLFAPQLVNQVVAFWQHKNMIYAPVPALIIGLILLFFGFLHKNR